MKPLRSVQPPPKQVPQVTGNGVVLIVAQYSWGSGTSRRISSPAASAAPIAEAPSEGETIRFRLATTVRPSLTLVSAYSRLEPTGTPDMSSETVFDCEEPGVCGTSEDGRNVTMLVTATGAEIIQVSRQSEAPHRGDAPTRRIHPDSRDL